MITITQTGTPAGCVRYVGRGRLGSARAHPLRWGLTHFHHPSCNAASRPLVAYDGRAVLSPARGPHHLCVRRATEGIGQVGIADVPRQHHAADAQGDECERPIVPLGLG
jgi:hypothetical protein